MSISTHRAIELMDSRVTAEAQKKFVEAKQAKR